MGVDTLGSLACLHHKLPKADVPNLWGVYGIKFLQSSPRVSLNSNYCAATFAGLPSSWLEGITGLAKPALNAF